MRFSLRTLVMLMATVSAYYAGRAPMLHRVERAERERDAAMRAPETIPLYYADAQGVADAIGQIFAQPIANGRSQAPVVGVDRRSNSLIVSAPRQVFVEVRAIAASLDQAPMSRVARPATARVHTGKDGLMRSVEAGMAADALGHQQRYRDALAAPDSPGRR
jgi:hypothetical protein